MTAAQAQISPALAIAILRRHNSCASPSRSKPASDRTDAGGAADSGRFIGWSYTSIVPSFHSNRRTHRLRDNSSVTPHAPGKRAEPTQQEKLTILIEGLFTEMAKKAFKRPRIATPPPCSGPGFSASKQPPVR